MLARPLLCLQKQGSKENTPEYSNMHRPAGIGSKAMTPHPLPWMFSGSWPAHTGYAHPSRSTRFTCPRLRPHALSSFGTSFVTYSKLRPPSGLSAWR